MKLNFDNYNNLTSDEKNILINKDYLRFNEMVIDELSKFRYSHSQEVAKLAEKLATHYGFPANLAYIAGILHDATKEWPKDKTYSFLEKYDAEHINDPYPILHQYTCAIFVEKKLKLDDRIVKAIKNHATGHDDAILSKIIYVADKCEPTRRFETKEFRDLAFENLDEAFIRIKKTVEEIVSGKN